MVKLNIGCGRQILDGWINIDKYKLPGIDIICDVEEDALFFEPDSVDEFLLSHVIEHIKNPQ